MKSASPFLQLVVHVRLKVQLITESCSDVAALVCLPFILLDVLSLATIYIPPPTPDDARQDVMVE